MRRIWFHAECSLLSAMLIACVACNSRAASKQSPRLITVAQSGPADIVGSDSASLQKAADRLRPGDTLSIGAGTYTMENSLFVPSGVTVRGVAGKTILRKSKGIESSLTEDGDYGETFLSVAEPQKFHPGMGVAITDDTLHSGWDVTISSVASVKPPYVIINPMTVRDYDRERQHARITNTFPILCAVDAANITLEDLIVDGNRAENRYIDGCRGGAIYMYRVRNVTVRNCTARNYNGDGISFQISDGVQVLNSESYGHAGYGVHPGTGSVNALVKDCRLHDNGDIGLFLCWRVRHGRFENNVIENNGHYGISIGHKDTDNEFLGNTIARNGFSGVYFRKETPQNSGSRNVFRSNKILDNGNAHEGYGIYVEPHATDLVIEENQIADTRSANRTQKVAIYKVPVAGP
ncbi:MAG TPA: right-handed parallel beta-helix repeat-containing protein [Bryobacteraceae bacterium]